MRAKLETVSAKNIHSGVKSKLGGLMNFIAKKFIYDSIFQDGNTISGLYKDTSHLQVIDPKSYIKERDPLLLSFQSGVTGHEIDFVNNNQMLFVYAVLIESVYHLRNRNLVLPFSFLTNLIQTFVCGSKTVTSINGKIYSLEEVTPHTVLG